MPRSRLRSKYRRIAIQGTWLALPLDGTRFSIYNDTNLGASKERFMHTLPANEIKRRGVAALEEALKKGPVHIIKNNRPTCVVLTEEDYAHLIQKQKNKHTLWNLLDHRPWSGKRKKDDINNQMHSEREDWDK